MNTEYTLIRSEYTWDTYEYTVSRKSIIFINYGGFMPHRPEAK